MKLLPIVTCEHASNAVPPRWAAAFAAAPEVLETHRGWDPGAAELAASLAMLLDAPFFSGSISRLLVELNRSIDSPELFSEFSRELPELERAELLKSFYQPYRNSVRNTVEGLAGQGACVLHLSIHSFTPVWKGVPRTVDLGLLYDPARAGEAALCARWGLSLASALPGLKIAHNEPYKGIDDGLTTALRQDFSAERYLGIELEVNQRFPVSEPKLWMRIRNAVAATALQMLSKHN